jgi:hypothetical protein
VAGDFDLIFQGSPFIRITGGWFGNTEYTFRPSKFPGVVTYTVEDINIFEQALRLFTQRPAGMPLPLGPRIPPILVR